MPMMGVRMKRISPFPKRLRDPALGRESTHAEVCNSHHSAHEADKPTRVVVTLGNPVTWCVAGTGRCDGRGVCRAFQMAEDLVAHLPLRDDGNDAQGPALTPRTRDHLQAKDPLQQPRPAPARRHGARSRRVEALLAWCREDRPTQMAVWRQAPAI